MVRVGLLGFYGFHFALESPHPIVELIYLFVSFELIGIFKQVSIMRTIIFLGRYREDKGVGASESRAFGRKESIIHGLTII